VAIWNPDCFTSIGDGDLAILTLKRATASPALVAGKPISVHAAVLVGRQPSLGESVSLIGFVASETKFENLTGEQGAGLALLGGVGPVIDVYPQGLDRSLLADPSEA